jgi:hypothetical protein
LAGISGSAYLLILAIFLVGIFHTIVPDHWLPIAVIARQQNWSRIQTVRAALIAGTGHVISTLLIGLVFWGIGTIFARTAGDYVNTLASLALVGFGAWIAWSSWKEMRSNVAHHHKHGHVTHDHNHFHRHAHYHRHGQNKSHSRTALLLILGSSPMLEGIPAFFAAAPYGAWVIFAMSLVFALGTILTYVVLCVYSTAVLQSARLGVIEPYGEVLSGLVIMAVGFVFWAFPII